MQPSSDLAPRNTVNKEIPERAWRFENDTIFRSLNGFMERLKDVLDLMRTIVEFNKLEKVEIGGSKVVWLLLPVFVRSWWRW